MKPHLHLHLPLSILLSRPTKTHSPVSFLCHNCYSHSQPALLRIVLPHQRRLYSGHLRARPPPPPPPPLSGFARLSSRRLISLRGPDSTHYLQGVITANISPSSRRATGFYAAFLNAQGRVLNDVFIYPDHAALGDAWLIEVDATEAEKLYKHIRRYKLRAKFDARLLDASEMGVWSMWQTKDGRSNADAGASWTAHTIGESDGTAPLEIGCVDSRAPGMGRRLILPGSERPQIEGPIAETTENAYRIRRYLKGVAEGQDEILRESALPQESNIDFMGGIDYRKGCYVGQELTIRTHHTGVIRKRILPLMIYGKEHEIPKTPEYNPNIDLPTPPVETGIVRFNKKGRSAGKWLAGVGNIGLGLCRVEVMTDTVVQGEAGSYMDGDEFKSEWTDDDGNVEMVKVKAFVPSWHLAR